MCICLPLSSSLFFNQNYHHLFFQGDCCKYQTAQIHTNTYLLQSFLMTYTRLRKRKKVPYAIKHFTAVMNKTLYDTKMNRQNPDFFFPLLPLCMNFDTTGYTKRSWWTLWPASGVLWSLLVLYQLMALTTNLLIQPSCSKPKECEMRHLCQRTKRQHLFFLNFFPIIAHI